MRHNKLALVLLVVLLAAPFAPLVNAGAETGGETTQDGDYTDEGCEVSQEVYESLKAAAEEIRCQVFSMIEEDISDSALETLLKALDAMKEAEELEAQDLQASAQLYIQALKLFRDAWCYFEDDDIDLELLLGEADEEPSPVDEIDPGLDEDIEEAKHQLLNRFQNNFQERLESMYSHVEDLEDMLDSGDSAKLEKSLEKAQERLLNVQGKLLRGEYDEALDDLDAAYQELEEDLDDVEDEDVSEMIKNVDKLEARIQRIENKKDESSDDETGDDEAISELKARIEKSKEEYKENKSRSDDEGSTDETGQPEDVGNDGDNGGGSGNGNGNSGGNGNNDNKGKNRDRENKGNDH